MPSASLLFSQNDRQKINDFVRLAETLTSAEIVPVVASASGRYDRAEDIAGLWLGIGFMVAVPFLWPAPTDFLELGSWGSDPTLRQVVMQVVAMLAGFVLGVVICSKITRVRRLFTPSSQMSDEVNQKARSVFYDNRVHQTQSGGGVLIYLSLYERVAVVLADQQVLQALGPPDIDDLCRSLTEALRQRQPTDALCQTIQAAGEKLKLVLPRSNEDINELPNSLVTID